MRSIRSRPAPAAPILSAPADASTPVKTFTFVNQSCHRRQEEIAMVRRFLLLNGLAEDSDLTRADLVILFTCAFCQSKIADMLNEIARIRSVIREGCELVVGSCLPKTDGAGLRKVFSGKTITPTDFSALNRLPGITSGIEEMPEAIGRQAACEPLVIQPPSNTARARLKALALGATRSLMRTWPALPLERVATRLETDRRMGVFISSGCMRKCSYCAIRFATGQLRSKPLDVVTRAFSEGLDRGYRKFELYADSIGDYGLDIGTDLGELFDWFSKSHRVFSVGIYDLHPQAFLKFFGKLFSLCRAGRIHYLYVPLQSGNARILKLMNRSCDVNALLRKLLEVRKHRGVFLQTSVIVGFPTETDAEFEETLAFLRAVRFSNVFVHFYSDMPNTESSKLADKIDRATMLLRLKRLGRAGINYDPDMARHEWEATPALG
ncbi:MAG: radical SAM protein [Acidobacteriota bacterium]